MKNIASLCKKLNNANITQEYWPDEGFSEHKELTLLLGKAKLIKVIKPERHRWYRTRLYVFKVHGYDGYLGIRAIDDVYTETYLDLMDFYYTLKFIPIKEVK